jgi:type IV pilus assembly protein PilY1
VEKSRFYSFKLFEETGDRARFTNAATALIYDAAAITDTDLDDADTAASEGTGAGWRVIHNFSPDERTASSALLLGGCVVWNTLQPNASQTLSCGATIPPDTAYTYQSDAITGAISCGTEGASTYGATVRATPRTTYIAPQQPSPVVSVNKLTGEILYSGVSIEPGAPPMSVSVGSGEIMGPIHWLEVPRDVHDCRHNGTNCK